jgi:hypothetical protein
VVVAASRCPDRVRHLARSSVEVAREQTIGAAALNSSRVGRDAHLLDGNISVEEQSINYRLPLDLEALRTCIRDGQSFTYLPFYGHRAEPGRITNAVYSQFYPVEFQIDGVRYRWAEQWMMAAKARLFGDQAAVAAILDAEDRLPARRSAAPCATMMTHTGTRPASIVWSQGISPNSAKTSSCATICSARTTRYW